MNDILDQLARNTILLPPSMSAAILAGDPPSLEEIVNTLLVGIMDCESMTAGDPNASLRERRFAKQALAIAFLSALAAAIGA